MHHLFNNVLKPLLVLAIAAVLAYFQPSCKPAESPIGPLDAAYSAETTACASLAQTAAESLQCRRAVNWKYKLCPSTEVPC